MDLEVTYYSFPRYTRRFSWILSSYRTLWKFSLPELQLSGLRLVYHLPKVKTSHGGGRRVWHGPNLLRDRPSLEVNVEVARNSYILTNLLIG